MSAADVQKTAIETTAGAVADLSASNTAMAESAHRLSQSAVNASSVITQTRQAINSVAGSSDVLESSTEETASSVHEMIMSIREISKGLEQFSAASERITSSVTEVTAVDPGDRAPRRRVGRPRRAGPGRRLGPGNRRGRGRHRGDRAHPRQRRVARRRGPVAGQALPGHRLDPDDHRRHRRPDEPAGAERGDPLRPGRGARPRLCRGRRRDQAPGGEDLAVREGDRRAHRHGAGGDVLERHEGRERAAGGGRRVEARAGRRVGARRHREEFGCVVGHGEGDPALDRGGSPGGGPDRPRHPGDGRPGREHRPGAAGAEHRERFHQSARPRR